MSLKFLKLIIIFIILIPGKMAGTGKKIIKAWHSFLQNNFNVFIPNA